MEVSTSDIGVGAVLSQWSAEDSKLNPCVFFSRHSSQAERNYNVGNGKLLASVMASLAEGASEQFMVWTDHKNLAYISGAKSLNSRQERWDLFLGSFCFTLTYHLWSRNNKLDALSRQFSTELAPACIARAVTWQVCGMHCEQELSPVFLVPHNLGDFFSVIIVLLTLTDASDNTCGYENLNCEHYKEGNIVTKANSLKLLDSSYQVFQIDFCLPLFSFGPPCPVRKRDVTSIWWH